MSEIIRISEEELDRQRAWSDAFAALPHRPETYYIVTYGCQMNAHDSEKIAGILESMGMRPASERTQADFVLHNTCCIRDNAERKALGNVTWLKEVRRDRPGMLIGVCGCMVQQPGMAAKLLRQYPFIDLAFGTGNLYRLPELLFRAAESGKRVIDIPAEESTLAESLPIRRSSPFQAYVTIMYGCNNYCSYCIVPYVRGRERSRRSSDILREIEELQRGGVREIMLLGQNVNSYGSGSEEDISFPSLLRMIGRTGIERIRFMTSHPKDLSDELIDEMAHNPHILRHFHLPVQSGSNRVLQAMNRRYTREKYLERLSALRAAMPDIGVTTDLIVAFPGETEAEFEDTLSLTEEAQFDSAFTFIYSPRAGTKAAQLPGAIMPEVATERIERLIALQEGITDRILAEQTGKRVNVLVTGHARREDDLLTGKCERNISVNFPGPDECIGSIVPVEITSAKKTTLRGKIIKEQTA